MSLIASDLTLHLSLAARTTGTLGSSSTIFLWRWFLGTQEENQASGIVSVLAISKNTM